MKKSSFRLYGCCARMSILPIATVLMLGACNDGGNSAPNLGNPFNDTPGIDADTDDDDRPGLSVTGLNGTPANALTSPWLASTALFRLEPAQNGEEYGEAYVKLMQYDSDLSVADHIENFAKDLDTCEFKDLNNSDDDSGENENSGDDQARSVSGGNTVTINNGGGPWFDIPVADPNGAPGAYSTTSGFPGALPLDATLSIPGGQFPNVPAYPLFQPVAPVRIAPVAGTLTAEQFAAPFRWEGMPNTPGGFMYIVGLAYETDGSFVGFQFFCTTVDDGEFTMPREANEEFANTIWEIKYCYERAIERVDFVNGIVFHQWSVSGE